MFGYISCNKSGLSKEELDRYQSVYCGLCRALGDRFGQKERMSLSFDMAFLALLLSSLYEPEEKGESFRCPVHPLRPQSAVKNEYIDYAADMTILLTYFKCLDDWQDERRISRYAAAQLLSKQYEAIKAKYPRQHKAVADYMKALARCEKKHSDNVEEAACLTGKMLAEVFVCREDAWSSDLRQMGFFLGKFIYLMDAYEDVEKDEKSGNYNPLIKMKDDENFDSECQSMLMMQMAECCKAFERLPIIQDVGILRNILYSGVWAKFASVYNKRNKAGENE